MTRPARLNPMPARTFRNRRDAGRVLAGCLSGYRDADGLLVLGLARGGVPVGWEVAAALQAPLDVFLVRKLGCRSGRNWRWARWPAAAWWW